MVEKQLFLRGSFRSFVVHSSEETEIIFEKGKPAMVRIGEDDPVPAVPVPMEVNLDGLAERLGNLLLPSHAELRPASPAQNNNGVPAENNNGVPAENNNGVPAENNNGVPAENNNIVPAENNNGVPAENNNIVPAECYHCRHYHPLPYKLGPPRKRPAPYRLSAILKARKCRRTLKFDDPSLPPKDNSSGTSTSG